LKFGKFKPAPCGKTGFILLILIMLISGCQKDKPPIKLGFALNLTNSTTLSIGARNGVLMAVDDINAGGGIHGHKIELIMKDDRDDPATAVKVDRELIREHVAAIIGHIHSPTTIAAVPVMNKAKMVMISPIAATSRLSGIDDYYFRIDPPALAKSILQARYAYRLGLRKMTGIYDDKNKEYAETKYLEFKKTFEELGGRMLTPRTFSSGGNVSLPDLAAGMTEGNPDGYYIVANPRDSAMICQHLRKLDPSRPIIATAWVYDREFIEQGGTAVEGVVFSHSFQQDSRDPAFMKFKNDFYRRYKIVPWMWETDGYECVMALAQALSQNPDPKQLKQTILKIGRFKGLQGDIVFDRYGDNQRKPLLFKVTHGAFVEIK